MDYLIRSISLSEQNRPIERERRIAVDRLLIGRDPASHVQLSDLAVALRHAEVTCDGSRCEVKARPGLYVEINGRKQSEATFATTAGAELRIASHRLRFLPAAPGTERIEIVSERLSDSHGEFAERWDPRRFALSHTLRGKRAAAWMLAALVLGLFLAWPINSFYDRQQREARFARAHADLPWSSGSLSAAHGFLRDRCMACHVKPFEAVRDQSCRSCHRAVHDHADPFRLARAQPGLGRWDRVELAFKQSFAIPPGRCADCHSEHEGPVRMPQTAQRFCSDCHGGLDQRLTDTRLENAADFGRQHPDFQPLVVAGWRGDRPLLQRIRLDGRGQEMSNLAFPHALHLEPFGGVAQMARRLAGEQGFGASLQCRDCHVPTPDRTGFQPVAMERNCGMCHSLAFDRSGGVVRTLRHGDPAQVAADLRDFYAARPPQVPAELAPGARRRPGSATSVRGRVQLARGAASASADSAYRALFGSDGVCRDCHRVEPTSAVAGGFKVHPVRVPERYLHKGWFDHREHDEVRCTLCHSAPTSRSSADVLLPGIATCRKCHGGERSSAPVRSTCAMCHDYHMDRGAPEMRLRVRKGAAAEGHSTQSVRLPLSLTR